MHLNYFSECRILEHKVFLELLKGSSINEIFDENGADILPKGGDK